ncbi:MAG: four-carbon acid sugar kinase family protein, partial [Clostridiales bacterium]|nr:four-carbon acid sugar kinase family protein [Clostridiales bacterium]
MIIISNAGIKFVILEIKYIITLRLRLQIEVIKLSKNLILACIADDFTGASDAASFLVKGGMNTVLFNGIPDIDTSIDEDIQAVVIALKTRTQETKSAVKDSLAAAAWVSDKGAKHLYIKYCSTFD